MLRLLRIHVKTARPLDWSPSRCHTSHKGVLPDERRTPPQVELALRSIAPRIPRHLFSGVFKGKDLTPILSNPKAEVQGFVHFTYEDLYFFVPAASHIRAIVEKRWKYAVYYDIYTNAPFEYEMYDLGVPRDQREVQNSGIRTRR